MGAKHIEVTTLTFLGHVTTSVTWPIYSPYAISYWCLTGRQSPYSTVFEIFASNYLGHKLDFSESRDVTGNRVSISSYFRYNGPQTHWGHNLHYSRSPDNIDYSVFFRRL